MINAVLFGVSSTTNWRNLNNIIRDIFEEYNIL
jgi:hypothetical protein